MTTDEKQRELARYRMQQAAESLDEARFLQAGGKSTRSVINRVFELRQRMDYREQIEPRPDEAVQVLNQAEHFVQTVGTYLAALGKV